MQNERISTCGHEMRVVPAPSSTAPLGLPGSVVNDDPKARGSQTMLATSQSDTSSTLMSPISNRVSSSSMASAKSADTKKSKHRMTADERKARISTMTGVRRSYQATKTSVFEPRKSMAFKDANRMTMNPDQKRESEITEKSNSVSTNISRQPVQSRTIFAGSCGLSIKKCAVRLTESNKFAAMTMLLTVYALFGDDLRLAATHKRADVVFDAITISCIAVFTLEVLATCVAKANYTGSFFFWLDVLPAGTLVLDLTFVANALFCNNVDGGSALKSGKAGRAGARAGRTVRIIRLIRLMKVYKMYAAAMQKREQLRREAEEKLAAQPGEDEEDSDDNEEDEDEAEEMEEDSTQAEAAEKAKDEEADATTGTRVGKKLSEMTTRRVIVLVLAMLFGLPQFVHDTHGYNDLKFSPALGMEQVYEKWRRWCPRNVTHPHELPACLRPDAALSSKPQSDMLAQTRLWYEKYLLTLVYMHHDGPFAWALHWVGFRSKALVDSLTADGLSDPKNETGVRLGLLAQLAQERYLGEHVLPTSTWNPTFANPDWLQKVVELKAEVEYRLSSPWIENCITNFYGVRVALRTEDNVGGTKCSLDEDLRCSEIEYYVPMASTEAESDALQMVFAFDRRATTKLEAGLSVMQTIFICIAVGVGALTFSNDAEVLLLKPIDRMMKKLESIKDNPMQAMRLGDLEYRRHQCERLVKVEQSKKGNCFQKCLFKIKQNQKVEEPMETVILERTIIKLGGLLAVCFGESGGEIVANYIAASSHTKAASDNTIDIMVAGRKMNAIIGFCQMRNLDSVITCLQEDALLFINQISQVVHETVMEYSGAPNKNMGCSFMLAWRFCDKGSDTRETMVENHRKLTDMAIMSCVRTIAKIHTCPGLAKYSKHPGLVNLVQGFDVAVGFGLHCGWAIEAIVGSEYKIDASYISPQVNLAHSLQDATVRYGVKMLMSSQMIAEASPEMASACRTIDQVVVKNGSLAVRLYTVDLDLNYLSKLNADRTSVKGNRFKIRQLREAKKSEKWAPSYCIWEEFQQDYDVTIMRAKFSTEFFKRFFTAYRNYECGEWLVARDMFYTCDYEPNYCTPPVDISEAQWPEDGPTKALLRFMQQFDFVAPDDWPGHRPLPTD